MEKIFSVDILGMLHRFDIIETDKNIIVFIPCSKWSRSIAIVKKYLEERKFTFDMKCQMCEWKIYLKNNRGNKIHFIKCIRDDDVIIHSRGHRNDIIYYCSEDFEEKVNKIV